MVPIGELISKYDTEILKLNHAASTLMQYRWDWHWFQVFCAEHEIVDFTDEIVAWATGAAGNSLATLGLA